MSAILIKNGLVVDPANRINQKLDILIEQGRIAGIGSSLSAADAEVIDAVDKVVTPGFIDLHAHLCDPGFTFRESIRSGSRRAARGGFTTVFCMPNTDPVIDNIPVATYVKTKAREEGLVRVIPVGALTKGLRGQEMAPLGAFKEFGITMVSDDEHPTMDAEVLRRAMAYNQDFGLVFSLHCEDVNLSQGGQVREGLISLKLGVRGIPECAETVIVARNILLAQATGTRVHIAHIGTAESVHLVRQAKARGLFVTSEVPPYHICLSEDSLTDFDVLKKFYPPLGSADTVQALEIGLKDGTIDAIATDHNPWRVEDKDVEFDKAPFGSGSFEVSFAAAYTKMVRRGILSLEELIAKFTVNPARIANLPLGRLDVGGEADLSIFDLNREWAADSALFRSLSQNYPISGLKLWGVPEFTIVHGKIVMGRGEILVDDSPFAQK